MCRELAYQIGEQFKALGSALSLRHTVIVGGMGKFSFPSRPQSLIVPFHRYGAAGLGTICSAAHCDCDARSLG